MKNVLSIFCGFVIVFFVFTSGYGVSPDQKEGKRYVTWKIWEVDRVASIWLMKRYVDKDAEFVFVEKGEPFDDMIPFDTPEAELRRSHNLACYQVILKKYKLDDPGLIELGKLIWDLEINSWDEKKFPESLTLKQQSDAIFAEQLSSEERLKKCFALFDKFISNSEN